MKWEIENGRIIYFLDLLFACDTVFHLYSAVTIDKYASVFVVVVVVVVFFFKRKNMQFENLSKFCKSPNFSQSSRDPILPWRFPNFGLTNIYAFFNHLLSWYARYVRIKFNRRKKNFGSLVQVGL